VIPVVISFHFVIKNFSRGRGRQGIGRGREEVYRDRDKGKTTETFGDGDCLGVHPPVQ